MEKRNCYLYRHIRLDKNEPFYIGIGTRNDNASRFDTEYKRAHLKEPRSSFWNNIVNKAGYKIEIVYDNLTANEAKLKEIEFISLYGRADLGKGILVNMTNGADGHNGGIVTESTLKRILETKKLIAENNCRITLIDFNYHFRNSKQCSEWFKSIGYDISYDSIIKAAKNGAKTMGLTFTQNSKTSGIKQTDLDKIENLDFIKNYIDSKIEEYSKETGLAISKSKKEKGHITSEQVKKRYLDNPEKLKKFIEGGNKSRDSKKKCL